MEKIFFDCYRPHRLFPQAIHWCGSLFSHIYVVKSVSSAVVEAGVNLQYVVAAGK